MLRLRSPHCISFCNVAFMVFHAARICSSFRLITRRFVLVSRLRSMIISISGIRMVLFSFLRFSLRAFAYVSDFAHAWYIRYIFFRLILLRNMYNFLEGLRATRRFPRINCWEVSSSPACISGLGILTEACSLSGSSCFVFYPSQLYYDTGTALVMDHYRYISHKQLTHNFKRLEVRNHLEG